MREKSIVERSANNITQQGSDSIPAYYNLAWLVLMILVTISAVVAQVYAYLPKLRRRHSSNLDQRHQDNCHRCQYFHNNLYLKCTIHPGTVLTEESIDCKDFCPKQ
jgi:hypothetical protein